MAKLFNFSIDPYWLTVTRTLKSFGLGDAEKLNMKAMGDFASVAKAALHAAYESHQMGHTGGTQETYAQGKLAAGWPRRLQHTSDRSLHRSGGLARFLRKRKIPGGYVVEIDPTAVYTSGDLTDLAGPTGYAVRTARPVLAKIVAEQMEDPHPVSIQMTDRMLAYLHALSDWRAGHVAMNPRPRKPGPPVPLGHSIVYTPVARKVWEPVSHKLEPALVKYREELVNGLRALAWLKLGKRF